MADIPAGRVEPRTGRRSIPEMAVDRTWRFFCSVRAAVYEIVILAVLVLIGTLRGSSVPRWIADAAPVTEPLVDRWYAWDVFHSFPFMAILTVLAIAITICTLNRAPAIWSAIAHPKVATTHGFLRNAETSAMVEATSSPAELTARLEDAIRASRYRVLTEKRGDEVHIYGDRFRFARLGTFPFHLALILILVGGIVGARFGFRDTEFIIPEGSVRAVGHGTDLSVRLDEFSETYRENGTALEYRSDLTVLNGDQPVDQGSITVNNPLTHRNVVFYQAGSGQAADLRIVDADGRPLFDEAVALGPFVSKTNPDAPAAVVELPSAGITLHVIAPDLNPANAPEKDTLRLRSGQIYLLFRPLGPDSPVETPTGIVVNQGSTATMAGLAVDFERERRFTVLQVAHNPGIPIFFAASFLLVAGLMITFYFPHRRVRGIVTRTPTGGSVAMLAPLAKRDWSGQQAFERIVTEIEMRFEAPVERIDRKARNATSTMPTPVPAGD